MVPDCVVLWVLGEEGGGELEGCVGVVFGFDLGAVISEGSCEVGGGGMGEVLVESHRAPSPCMPRFASAPSASRLHFCR